HFSKEILYNAFTSQEFNTELLQVFFIADTCFSNLFCICRYSALNLIHKTNIGRSRFPACFLPKYPCYDLSCSMADFFHLTDFLEPVSLSEIAGDINYKNGQYGSVLRIYSGDFPDLSDVDIVIAGSTERRGSHPGKTEAHFLNKIRAEFYQQYCWHKDLVIADIGNILPGKSLSDSYAAIRLLTKELTEAGKKLLIIGGSHDLSLG